MHQSCHRPQPIWLSLSDPNLSGPPIKTSGTAASRSEIGAFDPSEINNDFRSVDGDETGTPRGRQGGSFGCG